MRRWGIGLAVAAAVLAQGAAPVARAQWSAANGRIGYAAGTGDPIWTINPSGSAPRVEEPGGKTSRQQLRWSRDGKSVAYIQDWGEGRLDSDLYVFDGKRERRLTFWSDRDLGNAASPTWSRDGRTIIFICRPSYSGSPVPQGLCSVPSAGGPIRLVVPGIFTSVAWAPGGGRIAYADGSRIWIAHPDGSHVSSFASHLGALDWAPDGTRLAAANGLGQISIVDTHGNVSAGPAGFLPSWSPDGRFIAYSIVWGNKWVLAYANADGSNPRFITDRSTGRPIAAVEADWTVVPSY